MGKVNIRTSYTSRGFVGLSSYNDVNFTYSVLMINLGSNPLSKIEIVSSLNSFNLERELYTYYYANRTKKYNPKVYLGAIHTAAKNWISDIQNGQKNGLPNLAAGTQQKSGSWHE